MSIEMKQWWSSGNVRDAWVEHDVSEDTVEAMAEEAAASLRWSVAGVLDFLKSPIEKKLLLSLLACRGARSPKLLFVPSPRLVRVWQQGVEKPSETRFGSLEDASVQDIVIDCQREVGKYFADFVVTWWRGCVGGPAVSSVHVEADGHDFHQKTKKQAEHDKKRDRYFTAQGLKLLRFTGSEIHRAPDACAAEIFSVLYALDFSEGRRLFDLSHPKGGV